MKQIVRIAGGQGFWGDLRTAPVDLVRKGPIDYLVMDYLAEVTMSVLHKQKRRHPQLGYATDLVPLLREILPDIVARDIRVVTNGGGANPVACRDAILETARTLGFSGLRVGTVLGDDILELVGGLHDEGVEFTNLDTGESVEAVLGRLTSANVYLGAVPIVEALRQRAHIIITGRTADASLGLAPMVHEFGWEPDDWDRLASGTVAGHVLECGAQASGGNFCGDWRSVPDMAHVGFPIAEAHPDGRAVITKHPGTGGLVSAATVKEQLVYEIGDPASYVTPDCIADFTTVRLRELGENRVEISGVRGRPATSSYKVSMSYLDGFTAVGTLTYAWPDAPDKARTADAILRTRLADLGLEFREIHTELLGYDSCFGPRARPVLEPNEVVLRVAVRAGDPETVDRFSREIAPLVLTGPPGVTGYGGARPRPFEVVAYWPSLVPKTAVTPVVTVCES